MDDLNLQSVARNKLADLINQWEKHAGNYFVLAEREQDPLGKKFYQSTAMAYANCVSELKKIAGT